MPPDVWSQIRNTMPLGTMPGPKKPKDADSYLFPAVQELLELMCGVVAFDSLLDSCFTMHAYLIHVFGDIPAISMTMGMKGHNGKCPCHTCNIIGVHAPGKKTLYVPLDRCCLYPNEALADLITQYDPANLPLRNHNKFMTQACEVQAATMDVIEKQLSQKYSIKGIPLLGILSSLSFPSSFPYDFMHEIWENLISQSFAVQDRSIQRSWGWWML